MNTKTGSQRYNDRMEKVWKKAIEALQKYCKHQKVTKSICDACGLKTK